MKDATPTCPYCGKPSVKAWGNEIYPSRRDLWSFQFYKCTPCKAYVGCHRSGQPLGTLANFELREERKKAHVLFDPLWKKSRVLSRKSAYAWLARQLGIPQKECHIGYFDLKTCQRAIEVLRNSSPHDEPLGNLPQDSLAKMDELKIKLGIK